jgi:hypothetical protein
LFLKGKLVILLCNKKIKDQSTPKKLVMPVEPCEKTILPLKTYQFPYNYGGNNCQYTIAIHNALSLFS